MSDDEKWITVMQALRAILQDDPQTNAVTRAARQLTDAIDELTMGEE